MFVLFQYSSHLNEQLITAIVIIEKGLDIFFFLLNTIIWQILVWVGSHTNCKETDAEYYGQFSYRSEFSGS